MSYHIIEENGQREIWPTTAEPDGVLTFTTFTEARRTLAVMLREDIANAEQRIQELRWNLADVLNTHKAEVDRIRPA